MCRLGATVVGDNSRFKAHQLTLQGQLKKPVRVGAEWHSKFDHFVDPRMQERGFVFPFSYAVAMAIIACKKRNVLGGMGWLISAMQ